MATTANLTELISSVRIYWDPEAFARDEFGKQQGYELKPQHDQLFQSAIVRKLATAVVVLDWQRLWHGVEGSVTTLVERPGWWPAGASRNNRQDLLCLPVRAFGGSWRRIRDVAEQNPKRAAFWHDDPSLIFPVGERSHLCRAVSVGHEGQVFYFVYAKEHAWEKEVLDFSLALFGRGAESYRRLVRVPGALAGP